MIDFFKPVESAWARMETFLFKPFDISRWFVVGFTAWLASFYDGGYSTGVSGNSGGSEKSDPGSSAHEALNAVDHALGLSNHEWTLIIAVGALILSLVFAVIIALYWLGCRGQFMFLDNLVHNRAEVRKPWVEYRAQGNSLFFYNLGIGLTALFVLLGYCGLALAYFWKDISANKVESFGIYAPWIAFLILIVLGMLALGFYFFFLGEFGIPMMHRHGCSAREASKRVWKLACLKPLDFLIYFSLRVVMGILFVMLACIAGCLTCCIGFFPYISSVLTLPLRVFRVSYTLDCLSELSGENYWQVENSQPPLPPNPVG